MTDDKPTVTDKPAAAKPTVTDKPAAAKPTVTDKPAAANKPTITDKPAAVDKPAAADKPATADAEPTTDATERAVADEAEETRPAKQPAGKPHRNVKQRTDTAAKPPTAVPSSTVEEFDEGGGRDGWRRAGAVAIVLVAAFAVVVLWARPAHEPAPPVAQRSSMPPAVTTLNPTDIAYLQLMISLDTSAVQLLDLIIAGGDPVLAPIARSAAEGHRVELAALRKALADGGAIEDSSIHAGHDLPGMVVDADMAAVRAVPAAQQPAKALEVLREHLTGTTALCGSEAKNGADPATKAAAQQVLDAHGKLLAQLPAM